MWNPISTISNWPKKTLKLPLVYRILECPKFHEVYLDLSIALVLVLDGQNIEPGFGRRQLYCLLATLSPFKSKSLIKLEAA